MANEAEQLLNDLRSMIGKLETILDDTRERAGDQLGESVAEAQSQLKQLRARLAALQEEAADRVRHALRAGERAVRDDPWLSLAVTAGAALLVGLALGRRRD